MGLLCETNKAIYIVSIYSYINQSDYFIKWNFKYIYILFGVKVVLCILIPNTLIIGFSKNSEEFKYLFEYISTVVGKIFKIKR